jgi:hypothetical protein
MMDCITSGAEFRFHGEILWRKKKGSFSIDLILPAELGPGVYSASNRNEYQKQINNVSGEQSAAGA